MRADELLVIIPTRGRPHAVAELVKAWEATETRAALMLAVDEDDPTLAQYEAEFLALQDSVVFPFTLVAGPRLRMVGTLNALAIRLWDSFPAIGFLGDDHRPRTKGWDRRFAECLSGGAGIVYGNDLLVGARFPTAVMMTSDIIGKLGYMAPHRFVHLCVDLVWKDWGDGIGRITYLGDVIIEHVHPAAGKAFLDAGYEECNSPDMVSGDSARYFEYRDGGELQADLAKLKELL